MKDSVVAIVLHPQRMRMVQAFLTKGSLTAQELRELLPDIAQATLYRHLSKLVDARIVGVAKTQAIRGTVEKTYALARDLDSRSAAELAKAGPDEQFTHFFTYLAHILGDFENYIQSPGINLSRDGFGYRQASLYLNEPELRQLGEDIGAALAKVLRNPPGGNRRHLKMSTILMPQFPKPNEGHSDEI